MNFNLLIAEVALYALDVYYNNTYANTNNRWDTKNGNSFTNSDLNCPSCPYYDPYQQTYRNNKQESSLLYNIAKIPQWITVLTVDADLIFKKSIPGTLKTEPSSEDVLCIYKSIWAMASVIR